jgi:predicted outer membrane repeat protein
MCNKLIRFLPSITFTSIFIIIFSLGSTTGFAAEITVSPGSGANATLRVQDGVCTLFEAFFNAFRDEQSNADCFGGTGDDTIVLQADTYIINTPMTQSGTKGDSGVGWVKDHIMAFKGAGANKTIIKRDPNAGNFRLFWVDATGQLWLSDLTLEGGSGGDVWDGNPANTIPEESRHGGAILNEGALLANKVAFLNNSTDKDGGAIYNKGTAIINASLFQGNRALHDDGGAIYTLSGGVVIQNSTLSGNEAGSTTAPTASGSGGAIFAAGGDLGVVYSTIINNKAATSGGGIFNHTNANVTVLGTIIANNTPGNCDVPLDTVNNSLDSENSCGMTEANGNLKGTPPMLSELGDYGGPTKTATLMAGSPALNKGDNSGNCGNVAMIYDLTKDQRGLTRPQGTDCDWGAVEKGTCGDGAREPEEECDGGSNCQSDCKLIAAAPVPGPGGGGPSGGGSTLPGGSTGGTTGAQPAGEGKGGSGCMQLAPGSNTFSTVWVWLIAIGVTAWISGRRLKDRAR